MSTPADADARDAWLAERPARPDPDWDPDDTGYDWPPGALAGDDPWGDVPLPDTPAPPGPCYDPPPF